MARNRGGRNRNQNSGSKNSGAKNSGANNSGSKKSGAKGSGAKKAPGKNNSKSNRTGNKRRGKSQKITARTYWGGHINELPEPPVIHPSADPSAIVRSLGTPPLPGQAHKTDEVFTAVYDRAVLLATALAAAGELLED
jgi:hypothetical protein